MNQLIFTTVTFFLFINFAISQNFELINVNDDIQLYHLEDSVYIHVSWHSLESYGRFPSNGMVIIKNGKALMIDTPMDIDKTKILSNFIKDSLHTEITTFIPGHYHDDCIGGLEYLHKIGVNSIANILTVNKCKELNLPIPETAFRDSLFISFEGEPIDLKYFGAGHTDDNMTVYFPSRKILFGGCLIKSTDTKVLGNTADAVISEWDITVEKILNFYPDVKTVIPGHGNYGGKELLTHTIDLVKKNKENE